MSPFGCQAALGHNAAPNEVMDATAAAVLTLGRRAVVCGDTEQKAEEERHSDRERQEQRYSGTAAQQQRAGKGNKRDGSD